MERLKTDEQWVSDGTDIIDSQSEEIRKRLNLKPERSSKDFWFYDDKLRWYLLAISRDRNALETLGNFPRFIVLPKPWHKVFNRIIKDTKFDGHERFCAIATDLQKNRVLLPIQSAKGEPKRVPPEIKQEHFKWAKDAGADGLVGSFHSHPSKSHHSILSIFSTYNSVFSAGDFYGVVNGGPECVKGVIQMNRQLAIVFKSAETHLEENLDYLPQGYKDQVNFTDYWYRSVGWVYDPEEQVVSRMDGKSMSNSEWQNQMWDLNHQIADKHHLAFYRGRTATYSLLGRFHPPSINNEWHDYFVGKVDNPPR